jgi:hypothetical protein
MAVFYCTIGKTRSLAVVPETRVEMDGHPILTQSYSLYKNTIGNDRELTLWGDDQKQLNPNYLGYITFEIPGRVFSYVPDGYDSLSRNEIEEVIKQISNYRDNPGAWKYLET